MLKGRISLKAAKEIKHNSDLAQHAVAWATSLASLVETLFLCCPRWYIKAKNPCPNNGKQQNANMYKVMRMNHPTNHMTKAGGTTNICTQNLEQSPNGGWSNS